MQLTEQLIEDEPRIVVRALGKLIIEGGFSNLSEAKEDVQDNMTEIVFGLCLNCTVITIAPHNTCMMECAVCKHEAIYSFDKVVELYEQHKHKLPDGITNATELQ